MVNLKVLINHILIKLMLASNKTPLLRQKILPLIIYQIPLQQIHKLLPDNTPLLKHQLPLVDVLLLEVLSQVFLLTGLQILENLIIFDCLLDVLH